MNLLQGIFDDRAFGFHRRRLGDIGQPRADRCHRHRFFGLNVTYIPLVEERALEERFGESYREYKKNVPRWIPRLRPWQP